jgi:hypothetical protein
MLGAEPDAMLPVLKALYSLLTAEQKRGFFKALWDAGFIPVEYKVSRKKAPVYTANGLKQEEEGLAA